MILPPKKDDSCVLWFDFASVKNNTVYDQSKYGNHGTVYGAQHIGRFGLHGLHFDGVDDYVRITKKLKISNETTIITLVKERLPATTTERETVFHIFSDNDSIKLRTANGNGELELVTYYNKEWTVLRFPATYTAGDIIFLAGKTSLQNNERALYYMGEKVASDTVPQPFYGDDCSINIAAYYTVDFANIDVYFVALYNQALSDAEIRELYYYLTKGIRSIVPSRFVARAMR